MNTESDRPLQFKCPACGETKDAVSFPKNRSTRSGYGTYCKPCHNEIGKRNRERLHGSTRHYHLRRRYGIGAAEVEELIRKQRGVCAICRERPAAHVDHNHRTGKVRGVLCFGCNGGLGQFQDNVQSLARAIEYVERDGFDGVQEAAASYILSVA
jgi:5-methylcytosine-specific restriction endonuclease McrA